MQLFFIKRVFGIELLPLLKHNVASKLNDNLVDGHASMSYVMSHDSHVHF